MIPRHYTPEAKILEATVDPDGIVLLTLSGRITNSRLGEVEEWVEKVKSILQTSAESGVTPILVLCDVSGITHFETKPVNALRELLSHDRQYTLLTAIVGPNSMIQMLVDALIALTHRTNIKQFPAKKEALEWLLDGRHKANTP